MADNTKDLSIRVESDGDVLLDQTITVDFDSPPKHGYGEGRFGEGNYGG